MQAIQLDCDHKRKYSKRRSEHQAQPLSEASASDGAKTIQSGGGQDRCFGTGSDMTYPSALRTSDRPVRVRTQCAQQRVILRVASERQGRFMSLLAFYQWTALLPFSLRHLRTGMFAQCDRASSFGNSRRWENVRKSIKEELKVRPERWRIHWQRGQPHNTYRKVE